MKKKRFLILTAALLIFLALFYFVDWEGDPDPIPESMDEQVLLETGEQTAALLLEGDYDKVYTLFREDVQNTMTREDLSAFVTPTLEKAGTLGDLLETVVSGESKPETHAMVTLLYDGEERDLELGLAFDPNMDLIGIETELKSNGFRFSNYGKNLVSIGNSIANLFHK